MIYAQGAIPKRWIVTGTCLLLILYFYHYTPSAWKSKASDRPPHRPSRQSEKAFGEKGNSSEFSGAQSLNRSIAGLEAKLYDPYPEYNTPQWSKEWKGTHVPCMGPRGLPVNGEPDDMLVAHHLLPDETLVPPIFGSYEETQMDPTICFSSSARYRPYGYTEEGYDGLLKASDPSNVIWEDVKWGDLQRVCIMRNQGRFENVTAANQSAVFRYAEYADVTNIDDTLYFPEDPASKKSEKGFATYPNHKTRTAVVIEVQESREWTLDTAQYVRSMIMELTLHTGGEYEVFVLIEVLDDSEPIFNNPGVYHRILERSVPREFQDISYLYNRKLLQHWYPKVPRKSDEDLSSHAYAPLQLLSLARPDIEFFWLMDVDARYTGHHYDHLEKVSSWSKAQSREVLWELASQTFMRDVHKSWKAFTSGVKNLARKATIRGPLRTPGIEPIGPQPPMMLSGKDEWGIGEEADLITFGPVFDPAGSSFQARGEVANYPSGIEGTPRRATAFSNMTRTSKRLLRAMHHGQVTLGAHMAPSMFPASTALHHGLKVVAFPLPIFLDATTSPEQLDTEFNFNDWGRHTYDAPYRYAVLWRRMTFAITLDEEPTFADDLYKSWFEFDIKHAPGLCLPGLLLHPIQGV